MRVLYVIDSLQLGGAEHSLATMAPGLLAKGIELHVAYLHERDGVAPALDAAGAILHSLSGSPGRVAWTRRCRSLIEELEPKLVHTTLYEADQAGRIGARLAGVPVVTSLVGMRFGPEQRSSPSVSYMRMRGAQALDVLTSRLVARFHAVSGSVAAVMGKRLLVPRDRIDVVHRGRDPAVLGRRSSERRAGARAALGVPERSHVVLAVGRHEHAKGLDILIKSSARLRARLPGIVVLVAGPDGGASRSLRRLVETQGVRDTVHFLGPRSDVADLMCAADVVALPSRSEGFPGALLEAMAVEAPIVASDLASVREVVGTSDGATLVWPEDSAQLADAIAATLLRPPSTSPLRQRFLQHFTSEAAADGMVAFYQRVVDG